MNTVLSGRSHILLTKLFRPPVSDNVIARPRLAEQLNDYLSRQVIIVHAPPGYGKSTLVGQWAESLVEPVSWVSLDEYDRPARRFLEYFLAAVTEQYPDVGEITRALIDSPQDITLDTIADSLISDLEDLPGRLVLVLEDFHVLAGSDSEQIVERLVRYAPADLTLVITCRARPHLSQVRLRLEGKIGEIMTEDLRFNEAEANSLITTLAGRQVDGQTVELLEKRTEGWVTALILAGLNLRTKTDEDLRYNLLRNDSEPVVQYLTQEVAEQITPPVRDFLLRTSILEAFSPGLCRAVLGDVSEQEAREKIREIERANLFLIALDEHDSWYRYHHLFRDVLRRSLPLYLSAADIAELHLRASRWHESAGMISKAIHHALAAGDDVAAACVAEAHYHDALNLEDWQRLVSWLDQLPSSVMARPGILMMKAWIEHFGWRTMAAYDLAVQAIQALERPADDTPPDVARRLRAETRVLEAQYTVLSGDSTGLKIAWQALDDLPPELVFARSIAELLIGLGYQLVGEYSQSVAYLNRCLEQSGHTPDTRTFRLMLSLCGTHFYSGKYTALLESARTYHQLTARVNRTVSYCWATLLLGVVAYERNDLARAEELFSEVVRLHHSANSKTAVDAFAGLFLTLLNNGRLDEAEVTLENLRGFVVEAKGLLFMPVVESLGARLQLARRSARHTSASGPLRYTSPQRVQSKLSSLELSQVTEARVLLADGSEASLQAALGILLATRDEILRVNEVRWLVSLNTVLALVRWAMGERESALDDLRAALVQGEGEAYVRSIVDSGPQLRPLFSYLRQQQEFVQYIDELSLALDDPGIVSGAALEVLLTNREMEVLERLAARKSNKEIAAELFLSPLTVKRHTQSLFRKLAATNRREAVVFARQRGLSV